MNKIDKIKLMLTFWWETTIAYYFRQFARGAAQTFFKITDAVGIEMAKESEMRWTVTKRMTVEMGRLAFEEYRRRLALQGLEPDGLTPLKYVIPADQREQILKEAEMIDADVKEMIEAYNNGQFDKFIRDKNALRYITDIRKDKDTGEEIHVTTDLKTGKETIVYLNAAQPLKVA